MLAGLGEALPEAAVGAEAEADSQVVVVALVVAAAAEVGNKDSNLHSRSHGHYDSNLP